MGWRLFMSSKKDNASEAAGDAAGAEKAAAEGSSDEDEGALVIDEKNERAGTKRKAESTEASPKRPKETEADGNKPGTEGKLNDVGGAKAPSSQPAPQEVAAGAAQLTAEKVGPGGQRSTGNRPGSDPFCFLCSP
ncbi:Hepatoma-derived growth factor [Oryzias melastigma]|uniref:Hepatoma-derived growth factor n=1 Tax=Oryzias melastigma TaxID=30732 RepID=A0A834C0P0_ORYME|nr:Hepatoma-derived growth factor [Oryzias melastigma]